MCVCVGGGGGGWWVCVCAFMMCEITYKTKIIVVTEAWGRCEINLTMLL